MRSGRGVGVLDAVRAACRAVSEQARRVVVDDDRLASYSVVATGPSPPTTRWPDDPELAAALAIQLDAINFGSGWHPVLRKRPGLSGSQTIATAYRDWVASTGVPTADRLSRLTAADTAAALGQDPAGEASELMLLYARSLNDLGRFVGDRFGGSFIAVVEEADGSAARLVDLLLGMPLYFDIVNYRGLTVPLLKRAQITVIDVARATGERFTDLDRLTMFADNLVPHVLRIDGVLRFDPELGARIDAGTLLDYGSEDETEIRASAVEAVERLSAASGRPAHEIDELLWHRGGTPRYKAVPRHRCRTTAY
jgi:Potential Queuosine, Q, salvage protein family